MSNMLKMSDAAAIAIHAMVILAANYDKGPVTNKEIADTLGVSEAHLSKVMQRLVRAGLAESARGPHGGSTLATAPKKITLKNIYEAIEGPQKLSDCLLKKRSCKRKTCVFSGLVHDVNQMVNKHFTETTLADIKPE